MSINVFRHKPLAIDEKLGRVEPDGRVFEAQFGPDRYIGRVEVDTGRVWEARFGPDKLIGHVQLDSGRCYHSKLGPDDYVGRVGSDGRLYRHKPVAIDEYLGRIEPMSGFAHAGAALLLLALPSWEAEQSQGETPGSVDDEKLAPSAPDGSV